MHFTIRSSFMIFIGLGHFRNICKHWCLGLWVCNINTSLTSTCPPPQQRQTPSSIWRKTNWSLFLSFRVQDYLQLTCFIFMDPPYVPLVSFSNWHGLPKNENVHHLFSGLHKEQYFYYNKGPTIKIGRSQSNKKIKIKRTNFT